MDDLRQPNLIVYSLDGLLFTRTFLFVCLLGSRREIRTKLREYVCVFDDHDEQHANHHRSLK
jgi:hypothetical protein